MFSLESFISIRSGDKYETQVVPLIEVAVEKNKKGKLRVEGVTHEDVEETEFQIKFDDLFTPDPRYV